MSKPFCRRCLFEEIDPEGIFREIKEMTAALPEEMRTPTEEYSRRLDICRQCGFLNEGTCGKCGCFVELRAAKKTMHCPDEKHFW